jgi:replication factor C small subunit
MNNLKDSLFVEKYRPKTIDECILPDRIKIAFQQYVIDKSVPNLMLTGSAGVGKTTAAIAMCEQIGLNYMLINSSKERGINILREQVVNYASTLSMTGGKKVIILDEADGLTPEAQTALRGIIEEFSINCTFIATCNYKAKIIDALHSRLISIDFNLTKDEKQKMAIAFFRRVKTILKTENIPFDEPVIAKIIQKYFPDYRRTLGELQYLSQFGKIDESILAQLSDVKNLADLVKFLKDKNFKEVRKWVTDNGDVDTSRIFRALYDALSSYFTPDSVPMAVLIIAKYQYQAAFVADQEINLAACLTEIMVECEIR